MLLLAHFVIDPTYDNKMYGQSHENCAHAQWVSQISCLSGLCQEQLLNH